MYDCYMKRYLLVDLSTGEVEEGVPSERLYEEWVGGKGLGLKLLSQLAPSPDPLSPDNLLIFLTGPFTGTLVQTSARSCLVTKSPLTNSFLDTHIGGHFGPRLKSAGYDYIIIRGKAPRLVFLYITEHGCDILDASSLKGKGIFETESLLLERYPSSKVACIGPAGEKKVLYACIGSDKYRQFGRGGAGAVMGAKNLKAVVVEGSKKIAYADDPTFRELTKKLTEEVRAHPNAIKRLDVGTMMWIRMGQEIGKFLPTRNCQKTLFEHYEEISAETMKRVLNWKSTACFNCIIRCAKLGRWDGEELEGPEYETTAFLGSNCEIKDPFVIAKANILCDDLGLDTISTGLCLSFAMECWEKGLISEKETEGIRLEFGNGEAVLAMIPKIAHRQGFGEVLALGTKRAAEIIGQGSEYFAINTAGMEISGVNIKGCVSMGLAMATADFASHTRAWTATAEMMGELNLENLPQFVINTQDEVNIRNSLIVCDFLPFGNDRLAPILKAASGMDFTPERLMETGRRIHHLARIYNLKNGRKPSDDTLPDRFFHEPITAGVLKGQYLTKELFMKLLQKYYRLRGWSEEGIPPDFKPEDK